MKATSAIIGPNDDVDHCPRTPEARLGSRARRHHRQGSPLHRGEGRAEPRRRLLRRQRPVASALPERARRPVDQGQVGRHLRPDRPLARHHRRSARSAEPQDVARSRRPPLPERLDQDDDLRRRPHRRLLSQFMSLQPGDVISTGTPPGVGMGIKPEPVWLKPEPDHAPRHRGSRRAEPAHRRVLGLIWYDVPIGARRCRAFSMAGAPRDRSRPAHRPPEPSHRRWSWRAAFPASRIPAKSGSAPRSRA